MRIRAGRHGIGVAALVALVTVTACSSPDSKAPLLNFTRAEVSVPWKVKRVHGHSQVWTVNGGIHDAVQLDRGERYPQQIVNWRDGAVVRSILVVPRNATVEASADTVIDRVVDSSGHSILLASARKGEHGAPTVTVKWAGGRQRFFVVPTAP